MKNYKIKDDDYLQIENLIKITNSIEDLYDKMYELEIANKQNSEEYQKLIEYLKIAVGVENNIYLNLKLKTCKCITLIKYLMNDKFPCNFHANLESIMNCDYKDRVIRRIINILLNEIVMHSSTSINFAKNEDLMNIFKCFVTYDVNDTLILKVSNYIKVQHIFENSLFDYYLTYLNKLIDDEKYDSFKNDLISSKYNLSFINKSVENKMIYNKFSICDKIYDTDIMTSVYSDCKLNIQIKDHFGTYILINQAGQLFEIDDNKYLDPSNIITSLLRDCLIKSLLLFLSDDTLKNSYLAFYETVNDKKYTEFYKNYTISRNIIERNFKDVKREKKKIKFNY